ncbi:galactose oxidase [Ceratobasidium sp. AG-I]|nr:galactose oxidase [Ceratobasidium sp. AG-I]
MTRLVAGLCRTLRLSSYWSDSYDGFVDVAAGYLRRLDFTFALAHLLHVTRAAWTITQAGTTGVTVRPLKLITNSFCATGSWLSNGTLVNFGGNPLVSEPNVTAKDGLQGVRHFNPCVATGTCNFFENPQRVRLATQRWYPSSVRLSDGSVMVYGGAYGGLPISSQFLIDLYLNWQNNVETRLPNLPNGQRVSYPMSGAGVLLPLTPENNYTPEVLLCGGSQVSLRAQVSTSDTLQENQLSSQTPASSQCSRMKLTSSGVAAGWATESMPQARVMPDATLLPDGTVLIINGGTTGTAGYGNVQNQVGLSNADNPAFTPVLYNPAAAAGSRFSSAARLYHSVSTLLPSGAVLVAGSNPNADVETRKYATEYRVEIFNPPYMFVTRPTFSGISTTLNYGGTMKLTVSVPSGTTTVSVSLMDLGFMTHGVHTPPNSTVYPPGPGWIYVLANGTPSVGQRLMIGTGQGPPVNQAAIDNMLANTGSPSP